jgi:hypothetical protein
MTDPGINHYANWAAHLYAQGEDPITAVAAWIEAELDITASRAVNPKSYPIVTRPMDRQSTTLRILGILLDFGWTPPANYDHLGDLDHA